MRLWAVFNVILFTLSIFIRGVELLGESVTAILNSHTKQGGVSGGYTAEPREHGSAENPPGSQ